MAAILSRPQCVKGSCPIVREIHPLMIIFHKNSPASRSFDLLFVVSLDTSLNNQSSSRWLTQNYKHLCYAV